MPEFPTQRASVVLAHGKLFTKKAACSLYDVASGTYDRWRNRLNTDPDFKEIYYEELDKLSNQWQGETVRTLKKGLEVTQQAFDNHPFRISPKNPKETFAWAKAADSMSKLIKSVGDLAISTTVLNDEDEI